MRWVSIKLFLFTSVTVVVTLWLASIIGNFGFFSSPYALQAEFSDATGLLRGDVVKVAGVTIGRVDDIRIEHGLAVVTMSIDEGTELPRGMRAEIRFRNLVGQRMISMKEPAGSNAGTLSGGDRIPLEDTDPAFDLTVLFDGLRPLIRSTNPADINLVTRAVVDALGGRSAQVEDLLANLTTVSDVLASRDREIDVLLENVDVVTRDLAGRDVQLQRTLANVDSFLSDVSASRDDLSAALAVLDDAATRFDRIIRENDTLLRGELKDLETIFDAVDDKRDELRGAIAALPRMLAGVERVNSYGQWANLHLIHVCKDDLGTCGKRGGR